jgi:hypothetical protein
LPQKRPRVGRVHYIRVILWLLGHDAPYSCSTTESSSLSLSTSVDWGRNGWPTYVACELLTDMPSLSYSLSGISPQIPLFILPATTRARGSSRSAAALFLYYFCVTYN